MNPRIAIILVSLFLSFLPSTPLEAQVAWVPRFDDALRQAKAEQKLIIVDVSASWCPPCQQMAREVHTNKEFIEFTRTQVFMLLDAEKDEEGVRIAGKYDVQSYPTILVLDVQGREIDRLIGGSSAAALISDLKEIIADPIPYNQLFDLARSQPDDFKIQLRAGKRAYQRKDYDRARQFLGRADKLSGAANLRDRADALVLLCLASFKDRKFQDALDALDAMARLEPKSAGSSEFTLLRARILVSLKRNDEAFQLVQALLRSTPPRNTKESVKELLAEMPSKYRKGDKEFESALKKAQDSLKKKKFDEALDYAAKAEALAPQDPQVHLLIAAAHLQGSGQEADPAKKSAHLATGLQALRLARCLDPEDMATYYAAKGFLASRYLRYQPNSPEAQKAYAQAESRFNEDRLDEAMAAYAKTIELDPDFGKAYLYMGDCFYRRNDFAGALTWYQQAVAKSPADASAYRFASTALEKLGKLDDAADGLVLGLLADPEYPLIRSIRGVNLERHASIIPLQFLLLSANVENFDESMFDAVPPETVPAWREYVRSKILWRQEKYQAAFPRESFYHASFDEEFDCLNKLVEKWNAMKEADRSLKNEGLDFLRQVSIEGNLDSFVYLELFTEEYRPTYERWKQQNRDKAASYVTRFLCGAPQARSRGAYNSSAIESYNAGLASQKAGNPEKAVELYRKALEQEPDMIPALTNLAALHLQRRDLTSARPLAERWLALQPESGRAVAMMAQLEALQGNRASAAELFQKAAELEQNPDLKASYLRNAQVMQGGAKPRPPAIIRDPAPTSPLEAAVAALNDNQWSEAIGILNKLYPTLADGPEKAQAELMLSVAHYNSGNLKEARTYVVRLLDRDPSNTRAQELLKAIDKK